MTEPTNDPRPTTLGRTATRIFVVLLVLLALGAALASALYLIRTARESPANATPSSSDVSRVVAPQSHWTVG